MSIVTKIVLIFCLFSTIFPNLYFSLVKCFTQPQPSYSRPNRIHYRQRILLNTNKEKEDFDQIQLKWSEKKKTLFSDLDPASINPGEPQGDQNLIRLNENTEIGLPAIGQDMKDMVSELEKYKFRSMLLQDALEKKFAQLKQANNIIADLKAEIRALKADVEDSVRKDLLKNQLSEERARFSDLAGQLKLEIGSLRRSLATTQDQLQRTGEDWDAERDRVKFITEELSEVKEVLKAEQIDHNKARKGWMAREENLRGKIETLQVRTLLLEDKIMEMKSRRTSLLVRNSELEAELNDARESLAQSNKTSADYETPTNVTELVSNMTSTMKAQLDESEGKVEALTKLLEDTEKELKIAENRNIILKADQNTKNSVLKDLKVQLMSKEEELLNREKFIEEGRCELEDLKKAHEEQVQMLEVQFNASTSSAREVELLLSNIEDITKQHEDERRGLRQKFQETNLQKEALLKEKSSIKSENTDLSSKLQSLTSDYMQLKRQVEEGMKYKAELEAKEIEMETLKRNLSALTQKMEDKDLQLAQTKELASKDKAQIIWQTEALKKLEEDCLKSKDTISQLESYSQKMRSKVRSMEKQATEEKKISEIKDKKIESTRTGAQKDWRKAIDTFLSGMD